MKFSKDTIKKATGIVFAVGAGVFAMLNSFSEQKRDEEFEDLKKKVEELENR